MTTEKSIAEWLALAWAERDACPPPEIFLPEEWADLEDAARDRAARHLETCPACASERDLALAYASPPLPNPHAEAEIEDLLRRTSPAAGLPKSGERGRVSRFPFLAAGAPLRAVALAAAAVLIVAFGVVLRGRPGGPALPDVPTTDVTRSGRLELRAPMGDLETAPDRFDWAEVDGAAAYRLTLSAVDETILWTETAAEPPLELPVEVGARLHANVLYFWRVDAVDGAGARLSGSELARFRFEPAPPTDTETLPR